MSLSKELAPDLETSYSNVEYYATSVMTMLYNAKVLEDVLTYTRNLLSETSLEAMNMYFKMRTNSVYMMELQSYDILQSEVICEPLRKVREKQKYFNKMIVEVSNQITSPQIQTSQLKTLKGKKRKKMIEKLIRENRNAAKAKVMAEKLKREWDAAKEDLQYDVKIFFEKAYELLNKRKESESKRNKI
ncbi:unnamed protein product [Orchesella dallaii]|uniref:Uncharacterized protein n=1 Tax=Orchesella dallaii TaxID=48710 RepID=A0ABP1QML2_9HEXA